MHHTVVFRSTPTCSLPRVFTTGNLIDLPTKKRKHTAKNKGGENMAPIPHDSAHADVCEMCNVPTPETRLPIGAFSDLCHRVAAIAGSFDLVLTPETLEKVHFQCHGWRSCFCTRLASERPICARTLVQTTPACSQGGLRIGCPV